jgi:NAD(P)-dependent dehydrogenase (short-subunit alcohol dehydrogenase family)
MKSINGMTILVTGSTDGIGKLTATILAEKGAHVLIHGRNMQKLTRVVNEIKLKSKNPEVEGYNADFNALTNVKKLATELLEKYPTLDVLLNNAGIGLTGERKVSQDGYELRFAVNYLAPFLLTNLLIPILKKTRSSRIINVASIGQHSLDFNDIMLEEHYDPRRAYRQSKLALIMFSFMLAEKLKDAKISVNALHPGTYLDTKMVREAGITPFGRAESGADAEVYLATSNDLEGVTGDFYDGKSRSRALDQAYNRQARMKLWNLSMELVGLS